jgi:epoxyqueuosine reductase
MRCQSVCPENKPHRKWVEDRCEFSEEETALFLKHVPSAKLPTAMAQKLKSLALNEDFENLSRNLSVLVGAHQPALTPDGRKTLRTGRAKPVA